MRLFLLDGAVMIAPASKTYEQHPVFPEVFCLQAVAFLQVSLTVLETECFQRTKSAGSVFGFQTCDHAPQRFRKKTFLSLNKGIQKTIRDLFNILAVQNKQVQVQFDFGRQRPKRNVDPSLSVLKLGTDTKILEPCLASTDITLNWNVHQRIYGHFFKLLQIKLLHTARYTEKE